MKEWAKNNQGLLIKAGLATGAALGLVWILKASGVIESKEEKQRRELAEQNATSTNSPFNPNYYKDKPGAKLITKAQAQELAEQIYDAVGWVTDDESEVYAAFRQLTAKTQVSWLAEVFFQQYGEDLYGYLSDSLNEREMDTVNSIVNGMTAK